MCTDSGHNKTKTKRRKNRFLNKCPKHVHKLSSYIFPSTRSRIFCLYCLIESIFLVHRFFIFSHACFYYTNIFDFQLKTKGREHIFSMENV